MVLAMTSEILIFDEPLANLDSISADNVLGIMVKERNKKHNKTVTIADHRFEESVHI